MMRGKINFTLILLLLCYSDFLCGQEKDIGDELRECYLKDKTKFSNCLLKFWNEIIVLMKDGVPKLKIPKGDPMVIDQVRWDQKGAAVELNGLLTNFTLVGMSKSTVTHIKVDTKARKVNYNMTTPILNITSNYNLDGTVMMLPIKGQGKTAINATGVDIAGQYNLVQHGTGVRMVNMTIDIKIKDISFKFYQNDTDPVWDAINKLVSENVQALFEDIKPTVSKLLSERISEYTVDAYKKMPAEAFIT